MKQVILSVGKRHDPDLVDAIEDFTARLGREVPTSWHLLRPSGADELTARRVESDAILEFVRDNDLVVVLDEKGTEFSSVTLASMYDDWLMRHDRVVFVVGGAYGVDSHLLHRADVIWALSKLVFPHQLVRLIVAEQLYRARMITKGHPYHHT